MIDATLMAHWNIIGPWPIQTIIDYAVGVDRLGTTTFKEVIEQHLEKDFGWTPFYDYHLSPDDNQTIYNGIPIMAYHSSVRVKMDLSADDRLLLLALSYS